MFGLLALCDKREREDITEGLTLAVKHYYQDYEDADEVDPVFYGALAALAAYAEMDVDDIIVAGEVLVNDIDPSRKFKERAPHRAEAAS